jgi:hypothetical protein
VAGELCWDEEISAWRREGHFVSWESVLEGLLLRTQMKSARQKRKEGESCQSSVGGAGGGQ